MTMTLYYISFSMHVRWIRITKTAFRTSSDHCTEHGNLFYLTFTTRIM